LGLNAVDVGQLRQVVQGPGQTLISIGDFSIGLCLAAQRKVTLRSAMNMAASSETRFFQRVEMFVVRSIAAEKDDFFSCLGAPP